MRPSHDELTPRQTEILWAIADGRSNADIAAELGLGLETIKSHSACILRKMRARNRAHAVALAYHRGILVVPTIKEQP